MLQTPLVTEFVLWSAFFFCHLKCLGSLRGSCQLALLLVFVERERWTREEDRGQRWLQENNSREKLRITQNKIISNSAVLPSPLLPNVMISFMWSIIVLPVFVTVSCRTQEGWHEFQLQSEKKVGKKYKVSKKTYKCGFNMCRISVWFWTPSTPFPSPPLPYPYLRASRIESHRRLLWGLETLGR